MNFFKNALKSLNNERGAIFVPSVMFDAMRNKIGNIVFLDGNGGPAIRQLVTPFNPQSVRQTAQRLIAAGIAQAWRDVLTNNQRILWEAFGKAFPEVNALGKKVKVSGIAAYMRSNVPLITMGIARIDDRPANFNVSVLDATAVKVTTAGEMEFNYPAGLAITDYAYLRLTPPHSAGRTSVKSLLKLQTGDPLPFGIIAGIHTQAIDPDFATPVLGETHTITVQLLNSLNGALSESLSTKVVVTA